MEKIDRFLMPMPIVSCAHLCEITSILFILERRDEAEKKEGEIWQKKKKARQAELSCGVRGGNIDHVDLGDELKRAREL